MYLFWSEPSEPAATDNETPTKEPTVKSEGAGAGSDYDNADDNNNRAGDAKDDAANTDDDAKAADDAADKNWQWDRHVRVRQLLDCADRMAAGASQQWVSLKAAMDDDEARAFTVGACLCLWAAYVEFRLALLASVA